MLLEGRHATAHADAPTALPLPACEQSSCLGSCLRSPPAPAGAGQGAKAVLLSPAEVCGVADPFEQQESTRP